MEIALRWFRILRCSLLIAGTSIGAGMLGIPLFTAVAGFYPAVVVTVLVWLFMVISGLYLLEATLSQPKGASFLSLSEVYLGKYGRLATGGLFLFLYYCLMIAYFAAGAPMLGEIVSSILGFKIGPMAGYILFGLLFGSIVAVGPRSIDTANFIFTIAMAFFWLILVTFGSREVSVERFMPMQASKMFLAMPVLFSAFGYHNIIPSLCNYMGNDRRILRTSILLGTAIPLFVYVVWQWLIIGSLDFAVLQKALQEGRPVTEMLSMIVKTSWIGGISTGFAILAISTSVLGVSFSLVDFLRDGFKGKSFTPNRTLLTVGVFVPPFIFCWMDPTIFNRALGVAGGIGESLINGLLPVLLVYVLRYMKRSTIEPEIGGGKLAIGIMVFLSLFVMGIEIVHLIGGH